MSQPSTNDGISRDFQAVNLVNGMIVDGLGHVSLDSGSTGGTGVNQQQVCSLLQKKQGKRRFPIVPASLMFNVLCLSVSELFFVSLLTKCFIMT